MHTITKLLTTAILILALLSAGCTDTGGGSVQSPIPHKTAEPTEYPTPTDTPIESQHLYDIKPDTFDYIKIDRDDNLFDIDIEGSKVFDDKTGWETVYNDNENKIFERESYTPRNFDLYSELQPEQARALEDQYGYPEAVVMEQADTDGDGALDTVAVRYVGSKGTLEFEMDVRKGAGLSGYLDMYLCLNK